VGSGCSKYLVKEVAKAGRGSYSFVDEKSDNLKGKVITALTRAVEPSLKNCRFTTACQVQLMSPPSGQGCEAFRNDLITNFTIMTAKQFFEEFHVSFLSDEDPITKQPI
jgi:hypothetical protein